MLPIVNQFTFFMIIIGILLIIISVLSGILISITVRSKKTYQALNYKASTDKLTKLYNRGFLETYIDSQIEAAKFFNDQLSVIMIDIDHFKEINDSFGHAAGDFVLTLFSEQVLKCIRKTDIVARYGGDEFIAVLPLTGTGKALTIAERIREAVSGIHVPQFDGKVIPSFSCSLGISTYPIHSKNKDGLIKTSDMALYRAKMSGRNCLKIYKDNNENLISG